MKAWTSLNFGGIPLPTSELAALERLKKSKYKLASSLVISALIFDGIFFILAVNKDNNILS